MPCLLSQLNNEICHYFRKICHLHDGEHFGEACLIYPNQCREESIVALEVCELLRLHRRDFKRLFATNLEFYNNLEHIVREHSKKVKKLEEQNLLDEETE